MADTTEKSGTLMRTMSWLLQRAQLATRAGLRFDGKRDVYGVFGYEKNLTLDHFHLKYIRQGIAKRIVDAPASATWRNTPEIVASPQFITAWEEIERRYKVWHYLERADKLAGLGQYAVLFMGFDDTRKPEMPLPEGREHNLLFLQPFGQRNVDIIELEDDVTNPRFGMPRKYRLKIIEPSLSGSLSGVDIQRNIATQELIVHHSRVLHIADGLLQDEIFGIPRLEPVFNNLDDLEKVSGGSAEMFWLAGNRGLHVNVDKDLELSEPDAKNISDEVEEYTHELRRFIRTRGVQVNSLGSDVADPTGTFDTLIALISGTTGIPRRILLGSEAGQLAAEQDRANWSERIEERQVNYAGPCVLEPMIERFQQVGVLPEDDSLQYIWPGAFRLSPLEEGQTMAAMARASINFSRESQFERVTSVPEARVIMGLPPEPTEGNSEDAGRPDEDEDSPPRRDNVNRSSSRRRGHRRVHLVDLSRRSFYSTHKDGVQAHKSRGG